MIKIQLKWVSENYPSIIYVAFVSAILVGGIGGQCSMRERDDLRIIELRRIADAKERMQP